METPQFSRRLVMAGSLSVVAFPKFAFAQDEEMVAETEIPPLPSDLVPYANQPARRAFDTARPVGTGRPLDHEIEKAMAILRAAPLNTTPLEVARYLLTLSGDNAPYSREWPVRANPLVRTLFIATETRPSGDVTPWCAAFVNWCIARARSSRAEAGIGETSRFTRQELATTTRSAASGSFRCWTSVTSPRVGDIVVFRQPNSTQQCSGQGHVAFFLGEQPNGDIRILGGNQLLRGTSGAVTVSRYARSGAERGRLRFLGYRTAPALHG